MRRIKDATFEHLTFHMKNCHAAHGPCPGRPAICDFAQVGSGIAFGGANLVIRAVVPEATGPPGDEGPGEHRQGRRAAEAPGSHQEQRAGRAGQDQVERHQDHDFGSRV